MTWLRLLLLLAGGVLLIPGAFSQSRPVDDANAIRGWKHGKHLTGTWGGVRERAEEKGIHLDVTYTGDLLGNVAGGIETGGAYLQLFQFGIDWDPQPLVPGWRGARFRASGIYPYSTRSPTGELVGDLNGVDNIEAPDGPRLYEVWYLQQLWEGRFGFQVGNLLVDSDFAYNEMAGVFINGGFGWSQFVAANTGTLVPAYPFAAPGVRLEWQPTERTYLQGGAYDGDALDNVVGDLNDNPSGLNFELNGDQGVFAIIEFGYQLNQREEDEGPSGTYKIGGFYQSADFDDLYYDGAGGSWVVSELAPKSYPGSGMFYLAGEQVVWREPGLEVSDQGLGAFLRIGVGPKDRNPVHWVVDAGLSYVGLLPERDHDTLAFGFIYTALSSELRQQEEDDRDFNAAPVTALSDYEVVLELTYQATIIEWWFIQPDVQCILHPGGSSANATAWVVGLRTGIAF